LRKTTEGFVLNVPEAQKQLLEMDAKAGSRPPCFGCKIDRAFFVLFYYF